MSLKLELLPKHKVTCSEELSAFLNELKNTSVKSVIFDLVAPYNQSNNKATDGPSTSNRTDDVHSTSLDIPSDCFDPTALIESIREFEL